MDDRTVDFYNSRASEIAGRYESVGNKVPGRFSELFATGECVLDVGSGSGRDMAMLHRRGIEVWGLEPSPELRATARRLHPELSDRFLAGSFPADLAQVGGRLFDAVILSAVIMHIPDEELPGSVAAIRALLRPSGVAVVSASTQRDDVDPETGRDSGGRLFRIRSADELRTLFEAGGFRVEDSTVAGDGMERPGMQWVTLVCVRV